MERLAAPAGPSRHPGSWQPHAGSRMLPWHRSGPITLRKAPPRISRGGQPPCAAINPPVPPPHPSPNNNGTAHPLHAPEQPQYTPQQQQAPPSPPQASLPPTAPYPYPYPNPYAPPYPYPNPYAPPNPYPYGGGSWPPAPAPAPPATAATADALSQRLVWEQMVVMQRQMAELVQALQSTQAQNSMLHSTVQNLTHELTSLKQQQPPLQPPAVQQPQQQPDAQPSDVSPQLQPAAAAAAVAPPESPLQAVAVAQELQRMAESAAQLQGTLDRLQTPQQQTSGPAAAVASPPAAALAAPPSAHSASPPAAPSALPTPPPTAATPAPPAAAAPASEAGPSASTSTDAAQSSGQQQQQPAARGGNGQRQRDVSQGAPPLNRLYTAAQFLQQHKAPKQQPIPVAPPEPKPAPEPAPVAAVAATVAAAPAAEPVVAALAPAAAAPAPAAAAPAPMVAAASPPGPSTSAAPVAPEPAPTPAPVATAVSASAPPAPEPPAPAATVQPPEAASAPQSAAPAAESEAVVTAPAAAPMPTAVPAPEAKPQAEAEADDAPSTSASVQGSRASQRADNAPAAPQQQQQQGQLYFRPAIPNDALAADIRACSSLQALRELLGAVYGERGQQPRDGVRVFAGHHAAALQQLVRLSRSDAQGAEAAVLKKELHSRIMGRLSSPSAPLQPPLLRSYAAAAAACHELGLQPPKAFSGSLRELVAEYLDALAPADAALAVHALALIGGSAGAPPGLVERVCGAVVEAAARGELPAWQAVVAAGRLAGLGAAALEAARQVLASAQVHSASAPAGSDGRGMRLPDGPAGQSKEAAVSMAEAVLALQRQGIVAPAALLQPMEQATGRPGALKDLEPGQLLSLGRAFVAVGAAPSLDWAGRWQQAVLASLSTAAAAQLVALVHATHALCGAARAPPAPVLVSALAAHLCALPSGPAPSGAAACSLAAAFGELGFSDPLPTASATSLASIEALPTQQQQQQEEGGEEEDTGVRSTLAGKLLAQALASLPTLDSPVLVQLVRGLALMGRPAPPEVWNAALARATDAQDLAAAVLAIARLALDLPGGAGLPRAGGTGASVTPAALNHFLSAAGQHLSALPARSLVGLLHLALAAGVQLNASQLGGVYQRVTAALAADPRCLHVRDVVLLLQATEAAGTPLTQALVQLRPTLATAQATQGAGRAPPEAAAPTVGSTLRCVVDRALPPDRLADCGSEVAAHALELLARLQLTLPAAARRGSSPGSEHAAAAATAAAVSHGPMALDVPEALVSDDVLLRLLQLLQPELHSATPRALAGLAAGSAALGAVAPQAWLNALAAAFLESLPSLDAMTASKTASALTRLEQLAGLPPGGATPPPFEGSAPGSWARVYVAAMEPRLRSAPPAALTLAVQTLSAHGLQPSAGWVSELLAAASKYLDAALPASPAAAAAAITAARRAAQVTSGAGPAATSSSHASRQGATQQQQQSTHRPAHGEARFSPALLSSLLSCLATMGVRVQGSWLALACRQVEAKVAAYSAAELADALWALCRLGTPVREGLVNQLVIKAGHAKLAALSGQRLVRLVEAVAAAEGAKLSAKWWDEVQAELAGRMARAGGGGAAHPASEHGHMVPRAQLQELLAAVSALRRARGVELGQELASALAGALALDGGRLTEELSPQQLEAFLELGAHVPAFGLPPPRALERYIAHSRQTLEPAAAAAMAAAAPSSGSGSGSDEAAAASDAEAERPTAAPAFEGAEDEWQLEADRRAAQSVPAAAQRGGGAAGAPKRGKMQQLSKAKQKRAKERAGKGGDKGAGAVAAGVMLPLAPSDPLAAAARHLPAALAVARMVSGMPTDAQPAGTDPWVRVLLGAGVALGEALPASQAAELLVVAARLLPQAAALEGVTGASLEGDDALYGLLQPLVQRLETPSYSPASTAALMELVGALTTLGHMPGPRLLRAVAAALPGRAASMPPRELLGVLQLLAYGLQAQVQAVVDRRAAAAPEQQPVIKAEHAQQLQDVLGRALTPSSLESLGARDAAMLIEAASVLGVGLPVEVLEAAGAMAAEAFAGPHSAAKPRAQHIPLLLHGFVVARCVPSEEVWVDLVEAMVDEVVARTGEVPVGAVADVVAAARSFGYALTESEAEVFSKFLMERLMGDPEQQQADGPSAPAGVPRPTAGDLIDVLGQVAGVLGGPHMELLTQYSVMEVTEALAAQIEEEEKEGEEGRGQQQGSEHLTLEQVVDFFGALLQMSHPPPPKLWQLVEVEVRPLLLAAGQQQAGARGSGPQQQQAQQQQQIIPDDMLGQLLQAAVSLGMDPSLEFMQDLERHMRARLPVMPASCLSSWTTLLSSSVATDGATLSQLKPETVSALAARLEGQLARLGTPSAVSFLSFFATYLSAARPRALPADARERARVRYDALLQGLLAQTKGRDLAEMAEWRTTAIQQAMEAAARAADEADASEEVRARMIEEQVELAKRHYMDVGGTLLQLLAELRLGLPHYGAAEDDQASVAYGMAPQRDGVEQQQQQPEGLSAFQEWVMAMQALTISSLDNLDWSILWYFTKLLTDHMPVVHIQDDWLLAVFNHLDASMRQLAVRGLPVLAGMTVYLAELPAEKWQALAPALPGKLALCLLEDQVERLSHDELCLVLAALADKLQHPLRTEVLARVEALTLPALLGGQATPSTLSALAEGLAAAGYTPCAEWVRAFGEAAAALEAQEWPAVHFLAQCLYFVAVSARVLGGAEAVPAAVPSRAALERLAAAVPGAASRSLNTMPFDNYASSLYLVLEALHKLRFRPSDATLAQLGDALAASAQLFAEIEERDSASYGPMVRPALEYISSARALLGELQEGRFIETAAGLGEGKGKPQRAQDQAQGNGGPAVNQQQHQHQQQQAQGEVVAAEFADVGTLQQQQQQQQQQQRQAARTVRPGRGAPPPLAPAGLGSTISLQAAAQELLSVSGIGAVQEAAGAGSSARQAAPSYGPAPPPTPVFTDVSQAAAGPPGAAGAAASSPADESGAGMAAKSTRIGAFRRRARAADGAAPPSANGDSSGRSGDSLNNILGLGSSSRGSGGRRPRRDGAKLAGGALTAAAAAAAAASPQLAPVPSAASMGGAVGSFADDPRSWSLLDEELLQGQMEVLDPVVLEPGSIDLDGSMGTRGSMQEWGRGDNVIDGELVNE